jgi:hypothetical protein
MDKREDCSSDDLQVVVGSGEILLEVHVSREENIKELGF